MSTKEISNDRGGFKALWLSLWRGYFAPSNRKTCEQCEGVGSLFTQSGAIVECQFCFGDGWTFIRSPFDSTVGGGIAGTK